jgi:hypothetical protein
LIIRLAILLALMFAAQTGQAATLEIEIIIKDHLFFPSVVEIPAGEKVKLRIINQDPTPEEFESYELNREKVIAGNKQTASRGIPFLR